MRKEATRYISQLSIEDSVIFTSPFTENEVFEENYKKNSMFVAVSKRSFLLGSVADEPCHG
jgi:hypothetical protein